MAIIKIFSASGATIKAPSNSFNDASHKKIHLTLISGNFPFNVLKNNSYYPYHCNRKRSKQQTYYLIADKSPVSLQNTEIT